MEDQPNNVVSLNSAKEQRKTIIYKEVIAPNLWSFDYPREQIAFYGGIPMGHNYNYVSSSFLNGVVNYAGIKVGYMLNRYGLEETDWSSYEEVIDHINTMPHFTDPIADDVVMLGETRTCFWWFWFDRDSSDCNVTRIPREWFNEDFSLFEAAIHEYLVSIYDDWKHSEAEEAKLYPFYPKGWIAW